MDKEKEIEEMAMSMQEEIEYWTDYVEDGYSEVHIDYEKAAKNLINAGYGDVKQAVKEFADSIVNPIIDELVTLMFDDNKSTCVVNDCEKGSDISCGSSICVQENKQIWKSKIAQRIKELYGNSTCETCLDNNYAEHNKRNCPNKICQRE